MSLAATITRENVVLVAMRVGSILHVAALSVSNI